MTEIQPILLSAIICNRVIFDKISGTASLIDIIQYINAPKYPMQYWQLVFYCELTNGHGSTKTNIRLVDIQEDEKKIFEQEKVVKFLDVKQVLTLATNLQGIVFPRPGEYRFQLFANDNLLGERRIICRKTELSPKGNNEKKQ